MNKTFIGRYFKTLKQAKDFLKKQDYWFRDNNSICEFKDCFVIISNRQIEAINEPKNS